MEELIHIPYGACIVTKNGDVENKSLFSGNNIYSSLKKFYGFVSELSDTDVAYLYFLTVDAKNLPNIQIETICDLFMKKNKLHNSFYAKYGIYAYSISKSNPIYSCRIKNLTKDPCKAFSILHNFYENSVAPSHITEVLESMNEKTPA